MSSDFKPECTCANGGAFTIEANPEHGDFFRVKCGSLAFDVPRKGIKVLNGDLSKAFAPEKTSGFVLKREVYRDALIESYGKNYADAISARDREVVCKAVDAVLARLGIEAWEECRADEIKTGDRWTWCWRDEAPALNIWATATRDFRDLKNSNKRYFRIPAPLPEKVEWPLREGESGLFLATYVDDEGSTQTDKPLLLDERWARKAFNGTIVIDRKGDYFGSYLVKAEPAEVVAKKDQGGN